MTRFLIRRAVSFLITLFFTSMLIFGLTWLLPADVCAIKLQRDATSERIAECRKELGIDRPLFIQYGDWATGFVQGDWGKSFFNENVDVYEEVALRLRNSVRLATLVLILTTPLAILLGVIAALNENNPIDGSISIITLAIVSLPEFVTGIFLINKVGKDWAKEWTWLPYELRISGVDFDPEMSFTEALPFLTLPAIAATFVLLGYIVRLTRAGVIEELKRDYVRTAELKGMPYWKVILKHVLRNALLPTITVLAISMGWLLSGLVVIETVFKYPGLGAYLVSAIKRRDLPLVQAITMVSVTIILFSNFVADLLYGLLNPRIRLGE
jgi:peptide/nickel transport system permease protein